MVSSGTGNPTEELIASADGDERVSRTVIQPRTGFRAELPGLDIATLIQMTCARRERLVVRVASHGEEGFIYSADGRIVHATLGELVGEEAVFGMMAWSGGEFAIVDRPFPLHPSIERSTATLLVHAAQRSDEATRVSNVPPVFARASEGALRPPASASEPSATTGITPPPPAHRSSTPPPLPRSSIPPPAPRASIPPPAPRASIPPPAPRASIPPPAPRASIPPPAPRASIPPPAPQASIPPPAPQASTAVNTANLSTPPSPGRVSSPPSAMPPSAYATVSPGAATTRHGVPVVRIVAAQGVVKPAAQASIQNALRQSYDEEDDDVPTLLPPSPRTDSAPRVTPRGEAASGHTPRSSRVPPPLPLSAHRPAVRGEPLPVNDSALIASVRVDARGEVVGTFAGDGSGDLLPQLVAYVARLISLLRADFSLDPFEALHAELSGMRIVLFEDAGEMVGLMLRPGSAVQELRQRLGV